MARLHRSGEQDSLDLMLDAICNTFGAILLIAMLVILLINTTAEQTRNFNPPKPASRVALVEAEIKRDELSRQVEDLQTAISSHQATVSELVSDEARQRMQQLAEAERTKSDKLVKKSEIIGDISALQEAINEIAANQEARQQNLDDALKSLSALEKKIRDEVDQRARTAVIPKVKESRVRNKNTFFMMNGKLYGPMFSGGTLNNREVRLGKNAEGRDYVILQPNGGIEIKSDFSNINDLKNRFGGLDPDTVIVRLFVWPDCYGLFDSVRESMTQLSLNYELIPLEAHQRVELGGATSGNSLVQ